MKKLLSVLLAAVMIVTLSSSAIFAAPNNNPNASFNREKSSFENKVKNKTMNEGEEEALREQLRFTMIKNEGLPYGLAKKIDLPLGLQKILLRDGALPYGLAKRLMEDYPLPGTRTDIEVLQALIATANAKLDAAVETQYKGGDATIDKFELAIVAAEKFANEYDETKKAQIKTEIDKLKAAMKEFDDAKYVDKLVEVEAILVKLMTYKNNYYNDLTPEKKIDLIDLIAFITTFTRDINPVELTKGDFDKIVLEAKLFSDPLTLLYVNLDIAKELYKEPVADYLAGSHVKFYTAIHEVDVFLANNTTPALILIVDAVEEHNENLEEAIEEFEDNKLLGTDELAVLEKLMVALIDLDDNSYKLTVLINKIDEYVDEEKDLTVGAYNDLLEASKVYISDLYVYLKAELVAWIDKAELAIVASTDTDAIDALNDLIDDIEAYLAADDLVYEEMVAFYNDLLVAISEL
ncbi:MAG: hypothetical protein K8R73_03115 [Clostridiales bacterium]|nr:hypothetical protein [Clostridiales bacterium]